MNDIECTVQAAFICEIIPGKRFDMIVTLLSPANHLSLLEAFSCVKLRPWTLNGIQLYSSFYGLCYTWIELPDTGLDDSSSLSLHFVLATCSIPIRAIFFKLTYIPLEVNAYVIMHFRIDIVTHTKILMHTKFSKRNSIGYYAIFEILLNITSKGKRGKWKCRNPLPDNRLFGLHSTSLLWSVVGITHVFR